MDYGPKGRTNETKTSSWSRKRQIPLWQTKGKHGPIKDEPTHGQVKDLPNNIIRWPPPRPTSKTGTSKRRRRLCSSTTVLHFQCRVGRQDAALVPLTKTVFENYRNHAMALHGPRWPSMAVHGPAARPQPLLSSFFILHFFILHFFILHSSLNEEMKKWRMKNPWGGICKILKTRPPKT